MSELLPTNRVFLVRLSDSADPATGVLRGRIEHIRSGLVTQFSSFEKAEQFISEILAEEKEPGSPLLVSCQPIGKADTD